MTMEDNLIEYAVKELIKILVPKLSGLISHWPSKGDETIETCLNRHLQELARWSERIEFYGLSRAKMTDETTIDIPLKLLGSASTSVFHEDHLLNISDNILLIGNPGAGKTTALKRLVRKMLLSSPASASDTLNYPILLRLRRLPKEYSLYSFIAETLGLAWCPAEREEKQPDGSAKMIPIIMIDGIDIVDYIPDLLNKTRAYLLLDGLDEVEGSTQEKLEKEISALAYRLSESRLLVTTRKGAYTRSIEGLDVLEMKPLSTEEISEIAKKWIDDADEFIKQVSSMPYFSSLDRPLSLAQLLVLFERRGILPSQPSQIYNRLTYLYLQDWDDQRYIKRESKYAAFTPERKRQFLSALGFYLTYYLRKSYFSEIDLENIYEQMHRSFGLPRDEHHIVEVDDQKYEFSHLSMQEYFAANHLVKMLHLVDIGNLLRINPEPVAVAIAISPAPSELLAAIILIDKSYNKFNKFPDSIIKFLRRLQLERPDFTPSMKLDLAFLRLINGHGDSSSTLQIVREFIFGDLEFTESLRRTLNRYYAEDVYFSNSDSCCFVKQEESGVIVGSEVAELERRLILGKEFCENVKFSRMLN